MFCNLHNGGGNLQGPGTPAGAGAIVNLNLNGTPCDPHSNIFDLPEMVEPALRNFNLQPTSPCIDAGDTLLPRDPDGSIKDIGALFFFHYPVFVELTPHSSTIILPASGGSFGFDVAVESQCSFPLNIDVWTEVILPDGRVYGPALARAGLPFAAGMRAQRSLTQYVPAACPGGVLYYVAKVGFLPDSALASDDFSFIKLLGEGAPINQQGWACSGWDDDEERFRTQDSGFGILSVSPNPFNSSTAISFELQAASNVKLAVYDVSGREVEILAEGFYPAGAHQAVWEASGMASGVYFARLRAGSEVKTVKLLLVK